MTLPLDLASHSDFHPRVHVVSRRRPIDLSPHLVALDKAKPGDLVAMVSSLKGNSERFPTHRHWLDAFYVQGETGFEERSYPQLTGQSTSHAAHLVAEQLFMNIDVDDVVFLWNMAPCVEDYQIYRVHFADAILSLEVTWLYGTLKQENLKGLNPVLIEMGRVPDQASAKACVAKTRRYLDIFRRMLPTDMRDLADWSIAMPSPEAFLERPARKPSGT